MSDRTGSIFALPEQTASEAPWSASEAPWGEAEAPWAEAEVPWAESEAPWGEAEVPWAETEGPWAETEGPWTETAPPSLDVGANHEAEVLPPDERRVVPDTLAVPHRWVCSIDVHYPGGVLARGSGVLIGPRQVLTAAHVIYRKDGTAPQAVHVAPARNGRTATSGVVEPVGRIKAVAYSVPGAFLRTMRVASRFDIGLITLERDASALPVPGQGGRRPLGFWGSRESGAKTVLRALDPAFLAGKPVHVCGYPGDWCGRTRLDARIGCRAEDRATAQLMHHGLAAFPATLPGLLLHTADTYEGQSGSPVWMQFNDGSRHLVGIHVAAHIVPDEITRRPLPVTANKAVHLSADVLALVRSWMP